MILRAAILFSLLTATAMADVIPELSAFVEEELDMCAGALAASPLTSSALEDSWRFNRFGVKVSARAGFDLPGAASVELVPSIDFTWRRKALPPATRGN